METISALLARFERIPSVAVGIPHSYVELCVFFVVRFYAVLKKKSNCLWFDAQRFPRDGIVMRDEYYKLRSKEIIF